MNPQRVSRFSFHDQQMRIWVRGKIRLEQPPLVLV
jgi:hypothetical protein